MMLQASALLMIMFGFWSSEQPPGIADVRPGKPADRLPATSIPFEYPDALAVDQAGDLLIAVSRQHQVFRMKKSGEISLIAGSGKKGFSGDGGLATDASLNNPQGVTVDAAGNVIVADTYNNRIRQVDAPHGDHQYDLWRWDGEPMERQPPCHYCELGAAHGIGH